MNDRRTTFFFWLGVFVFPVFWSWFTLARRFTSWQRFAAFSWLVIFLTACALHWPELHERWALMPIAYPMVIGLVTVALWTWLFFRIWFRFLGVLELLVLVDIVAMISPLQGFARSVGTPFSFDWLVWPLIPALIHLLVDPVSAWWRRLRFRHFI